VYMIRLDKFKLRDYQKPIWDALENRGYRKVICILPRRAGKDICAWNYCIRTCLKRTCMITYVLPTYRQAKSVIWDAIASDGVKFIDFIPRELIKSMNSQDMKIFFKNGSLLQCIGGESYDRSIRGTNPYGVVFSEYAYMDRNAYLTARPILAANNGWALFIGTPYGCNHFFDLYTEGTRYSDEWFVYKLTTDDTQHIPIEELEKERRAMSEELFMQEYYTSFLRGVEGSYYSRYINVMRQEGRIGFFPWEPSLPVHTAWDLGVHDGTYIIFFQVMQGNTIRIIDCYSQCGTGLEHFSKILKEKPYSYGTHLAPHDIKVRELSDGCTRLDKASMLGINFVVLPQRSIEDGIELVWTTFNRICINEKPCESMIRAIENYHREWDPIRRIYNKKPVHDWTSHYSDALRYLCSGLPYVESGQTTAEELERRYREARYGASAQLPKFFRD